jgi:hypothetical protein
MAIFDPSKHQSDDNQQPLPAGPYLVALVGFERKRSDRTGGDYLRGRFKVLHGRAKGRTFYSTIGLDVRRDGAAARLGLYCKAVGVTKPFDLDDDAAVTRALVGKPFKAQISQTQNGQYVNNDVQRYLLDGMTSEEQEAAEAWWQDWSERSLARHDNGSGDWNPNDYAEATQSGGGTRVRGGDDDIPFDFA